MNSVEFTIRQSRSFTFEMSTAVEPRAFHFHAFLLRGLDIRRALRNRVLKPRLNQYRGARARLLQDEALLAVCRLCNTTPNPMACQIYKSSSTHINLFGAGHVVTPRVAIIANVSLVNGHRLVESE